MGKKRHAVNLLFTIALLAVFAMSAMFVSAMGAEVYSNSAAKMQNNFNTRTSLVYISEKIRQNGQENYRVESFRGGSALVMRETYDGKGYDTWIFVSGGKLREIMAESGTDITGFSGQPIMDLKSIDFQINGKLLTITVTTPDSKLSSLQICRRN